MAKADITQLDLHQLLTYDPASGVFTWVMPAAHCMSPGDRAGCVRHGGYRTIKLEGKAYAEHRLAWLYMTGVWPPDDIDHVNRNKTDNRFENLRLATRKQNSENRKAREGSASQFRGVSWSCGKWHAVIMHFGVQISLGYFDDIEAAKSARLKAEAKLFTHGRTEPS